MVKEILKLGNPELYQISTTIEKDEIMDIRRVVHNLHDTMMDFRRTYNCGRAIAAPQIGVFKRLIYMNTDVPVVLINPVLIPDESKGMYELIDDCMSFPGLFVRVLRFKKSIIQYKDLNWNDCEMLLEGDLSELLQHEYDHLNGILATMRAIDSKSLFFNMPK